jgi:uncharacterized oxidoreductase
LQGAGASAGDAEIIASHSIGANLAGHDSHGIIQIPTYIDRMKRGHIDPNAEFEIVKDTPTTTVVDGHWGFGYVVSERAMKMTIEKAKKQNVAATTVFRQSHVGRVADYPMMCAEQGLIGIMTADSGRSAKTVVPFGGREPRLGTNPICIAMPSNLPSPLFIDMATSAVAAGKIGVAVARNAPIPEGWILDSEGRPTTDPTLLRDGGGMILPLGGSEAHKGYGLSVMVEIFSGILTGLGFGHDPSGRHNDGCFMAAFNVEAFRPLEEFKQEVTEFAKYLKSTPKAHGFDEIYYPGELEHIKTQKALKDGISVEDSTWNRLKAQASEFGLSEKLGL